MNELSLNKNGEENVVDKNSNDILQSKEKDSGQEYFSERAKKLVTAVYLVTNLIPQTDPLRLSIRESAIRLLSLVKTDGSSRSLVELGNELKKQCKNVIEMLEIAFFAGYISEMNFSILKPELDLFLNEISNYQGAQPHLLSASLKVRFGPKPLSNGGPVVAKRHVSPAHAVSGQVATKSVVETKKTSRREAILSIIKKRGKVSIKDISSVVVNCSEKTIQRELSVLVHEGVLKKSGDRRWSVYSLVE